MSNFERFWHKIQPLPVQRFGNVFATGRGVDYELVCKLIELAYTSGYNDAMRETVDTDKIWLTDINTRMEAIVDFFKEHKHD